MIRKGVFKNLNLSMYKSYRNTGTPSVALLWRPSAQLPDSRLYLVSAFDLGAIWSVFSRARNRAHEAAILYFLIELLRREETSTS